MRIRLFASHVRQRGSITPASLSAGSTWHARPLAASACTVVPAADVAPGHSRASLRPMRHLTHQHQRQWAGVTHGALRGGALTRPVSGNGPETGTVDYWGYYTHTERMLYMFHTHTQNEGIYRALLAQLDKLERHNRQGSYKTRQRYYEAMQRFCRFLADAFHLQKLANISGKHLVAYVHYLQEHGKSASTVKTDLAAIRSWHDKLGDAKYKLPSNADLSSQAPLERRRIGGMDRHWTPEQFAAFVAVCREAGRDDYADIATLTYYVGLRIHEVCRLDTAAVEAWERTGALTVKGKGGHIRSVPVTAEAAKQALRDRRAAVQRGHKLFVSDDVATDAYIHAFQAFLREHRPDQGANPRPLTHHGMRHSYAVRQYREAVDGGATEYRAKLEVSKLLGHGRADVTDVYLGSLDEDSGRKL